MVFFRESRSDSDAKIFWYAPAEHIFSSTAVTLMILLRNASKVHDENRRLLQDVGELFEKLSPFVRTGKDRIREIVDDEEAVRDSDLPFMTPRAIESIGDSLKRLGEANVLPMFQVCPSRAFAEGLLEICGGDAQGHLSHARRHIQGFLELCEKSSHTKPEFVVEEL